MDMTAPVTQATVAGGTRVQFVLPKGVTLATAPEPIDSRVQLRAGAGRHLGGHPLLGHVVSVQLPRAPG